MDPEENIYTNLDELGERNQTTASDIYHTLHRGPVDHTGATKPVRMMIVGQDRPAVSQNYRLSTACLGLLCLLLLTTIIAVSIRYDDDDEDSDHLANHTSMTANHMITYSNLTKERDQLQTSYHQLQTSYGNLTEEKDHLQTSCNKLSYEINQLQTSYIQLQTSHNQLQTNYNTLAREKDEHQSANSVLVRNFTDGCGCCPVGWRRLRSSCYLLSTEKNNWSNSRQDCLTRGADLAIINGREEQEFINQLGGALKVWIGLTDSEREGAWRWVDGTPLTVMFWIHNEPNDAGGREDCASFNSYSSPHNQPIQSWNDEQCSDAFKWLCEGVLKL